ncbi:mannoprotein [Bulinus truncatus]|nr:mannoprotein [Bulinus truncatus]
MPSPRPRDTSDADIGIGRATQKIVEKTKRTIEDLSQSKKSHNLSDSDDESEAVVSKKIKPDSSGSSDDVHISDSIVKCADSDINVPTESNVTDVPIPSPEDVRENIKRKFLVEMPEDFYHFWDFCKRLHPKDPTRALADSLNLYLVGPFDVLQNKHKGVTKNKHGGQPNFLLHYRYFYDPPEFQTVLTTKEKSLLHFGYYRDDPKDAPVSVASNAPGESSKEKIIHCGDNLFAAVYNHASKIMKTSLGEKRKQLEKLIKSLEEESIKLDLPLAANSKRLKDRQKKVVCPTFHGAGIVVPVDANDVGYRPVPETPANLRAMLKKIVESKTEAERDKSFDELQEIITYIQFANDECDYGEGLELGLDLFSYGSNVFHPQISTLLPLAYQLLKRPEFSRIIEAHLKCRRSLSESVDELEC